MNLRDNLDRALVELVRRNSGDASPTIEIRGFPQLCRTNGCPICDFGSYDEMIIEYRREPTRRQPWSSGEYRFHGGLDELIRELDTISNELEGQ